MSASDSILSKSAPSELMHTPSLQLSSSSQSRISPFFNRAVSPSPYGYDSSAESEIDKHNLETIRQAYRLAVKQTPSVTPVLSSSSSGSSSSRKSLGLDVSDEGKLYFSVRLKKPSKTLAATIQSIIDKVCYPLNNSSDPIAVSQALNYLHKLQRWLPVVLGPKDLKKVKFPLLKRCMGGPKEATALTGNGFKHWNHVNSNKMALTEKRELFEGENPDFYQMPEQEQIRAIRIELDSTHAEIELLRTQISELKTELPTLQEGGEDSIAALEEQKAIIQQLEDTLSYLEIQKGPILNTLLNYYFYLQESIDRLTTEFTSENPLVQDLYREINDFNSLIARRTLPVGSGINSPVTHHGASLFEKQGAEISAAKPQILGVEITNTSPVSSTPLSLEKSAIDLQFQNMAGDEGDWAGHHEILSYVIDQKLFGGAMQIAPVIWSANPLVKRDISTCTEHAYIKNKGTADAVLNLDPENVLWMVIALTLFKNPDLHGGNFLVKKHNQSIGKHQIIPIDFGRMLLADPVSINGACRVSVFMEWLMALEEQYGPESLQFSKAQRKMIKKITPEMIEETIKEVVGFEGLNAGEKYSWTLKILHMKANVVLLQTAIQNKLSAKELLICLMPDLRVLLEPQKQVEIRDFVTTFQETTEDKAYMALNGGEYVTAKLREFRELVRAGNNAYFDYAWGSCTTKLKEGSIKNANEFIAVFQKSLRGTLQTVSADAVAVFNQPGLIATLKAFEL